MSTSGSQVRQDRKWQTWQYTMPERIYMPAFEVVHSALLTLECYLKDSRIFRELTVVQTWNVLSCLASVNIVPKLNVSLIAFSGILARGSLNLRVTNKASLKGYRIYPSTESRAACDSRHSYHLPSSTFTPWQASSLVQPACMYLDPASLCNEADASSISLTALKQDPSSRRHPLAHIT